MLFEFSDEHEELRRTVRDFLAKESEEARVRELMADESGLDRTLWARMAEELGIVGLIVDEKHGGAGFSNVELAIVMEEMGRALLVAPYLSSAVLASSALELAADAAAQDELLPKLASGERIATLAFSEAGNPWSLDAVSIEAEKKDDGHALTGRKVLVLDGHVADDLLVVAREGGALALFHVDASAEGVSREAVPALDPTRKLGNVELSGAPARLISSGDAKVGLERALTRTLGALAAEQLGGAQRVLEMATDYAKTRLQFGRPIGSYQAIKHKCADMLVDVELARSAAYNVAFADESDVEGTSMAASMAKSFCSEAYYHAADENIQIHGGMGFTWEHSAHLYYKRARASEALFGSPVAHRERVAAQIGVAAG
jgi:alkylation response protein AidB-like acyl-CoA dehydrogenase